MNKPITPAIPPELDSAAASQAPAAGSRKTASSAPVKKPGVPLWAQSGTAWPFRAAPSLSDRSSKNRNRQG